MSSKEILVQNNSGSNLCVNDILLKKGESLTLSNAEEIHIYMNENKFYNEIFNIYNVFLGDYFISYYESKILKQ